MTCFPSILELCHPFCENILIVITFYIRLSSLFTYSITIVVLFSLLPITYLTFAINGRFGSVCQPGFWMIFSGTSLNSSCLHNTFFLSTWTFYRIPLDSYSSWHRKLSILIHKIVTSHHFYFQVFHHYLLTIDSFVIAFANRRVTTCFHLVCR